MPNWCHNVITISGEGLPELLKTCADDIENNIDIMKRLIPLPKELEFFDSGNLSEIIKRWREQGRPPFKGQDRKWVRCRKRIFYAPQAVPEDRKPLTGIEKTYREIAQENGLVTVRDWANFIADIQEKYDAASWYEWKCKNLGSKWYMNSYGLEYLVDEDEDLRIMGNTAWGPSLAGWQTISGKFGVTTTISYEECGNDFVGEVQFENGLEVYHLEAEFYVQATSSPLSRKVFNALGYAIRVYSSMEDGRFFPAGLIWTSDDLAEECEDVDLENTTLTYKQYLTLCAGKIVDPAEEEESA